MIKPISSQHITDQKSPVTSRKKRPTAAHNYTGAPTAGFAFTREHFAALADLALAQAKKLGASDAAVELSEGNGLSVNVRKNKLETIERNRDKSLTIVVYIGQRHGSASTSDFSGATIRQTVQAAYDIALYTAEDPFAGLADYSDIAPAKTHFDLDLFHPWDIDSESACALAQRAEHAAFAVHPLITNSEGAGVSAQQSHFFAAHTNGFRGGYASSRHSISVSPIAGSGDDMQRDSWFSSMRDAACLANPESIGRYAAERALARLGAKRLSTRQCPILFEATLAAGLLGAYVQATNGAALYRQSSFLENSLDQQVFPEHIEIEENPFLIGGKGSCPFDAEGVRVAPRKVVRNGRVQGYFLNSYTARKLNMKTSGNAGGSHNLLMRSKHTQSGDDLTQMLRKLGRGLFVTELMGQGVNYVTGDYSRGASGFWVENGEIAYPVHEITIAGNLKDMFANITAIGSDTYTYGAKSVGSVLLPRMIIAGT